MDGAQHSNSHLINALVDFDDVKVWSLLVTLLGDLAPQDGQSLSGPVLSHLLGPMGVRPEAQRVALHRLKKDGWITVAKTGRISEYALSPRARAETEGAGDRVYGASIDRPGRCAMFVFEAAAEIAADAQIIPLGGPVFLADQSVGEIAGALRAELPIAELPGWARARVIPAKTNEAYGRLLPLLESHRPARAAMAPQDQVTVRLLILHRWRRLVLSHSRTAENLMGPDWIGAACRAEVHGWLSAFDRPTPDQLREDLS